MSDTYVNVKMRTGEDIVAVLLEKNETHIKVQRPLLIIVDVDAGFFVKSWNIFSKGDVVNVRHEDMIWCEDANEKAIEYYNEFLDQIDDKGTSYDSEIEDTLEAMYDSKYETKH